MNSHFSYLLRELICVRDTELYRSITPVSLKLLKHCAMRDTFIITLEQI